jgi:hypothetical protein
MFGFKRLLRMLAPLAVVCGALFAASCGGNSTPSATATIGPSQGYSITLTTSGGAITLPAVTNNVYATLQYQGSNVAIPSPFPSSGITLITTSAVSAPTNAPVPTSLKRTPLSRTNATGALYLTFTVGANLPGNVFSSETLNLGTTLPQNVPYYVELDDLTNTANPYVDTFPAGAITNSTVTFANANGFIPTFDLSTYTFKSTDTYLLQFYYLGTGTAPTPTPTPNPSASPSPTPTPIGAVTTVPFGTAQSISLPVTIGGFVGTVTVPAAGTSAASLTTTAQSALPTGIAAIGTANNTYPFYSLGFSSSAAVGTGSPGIQLQLPTNLASTANQILAALCTVAAPCPIETQQPAISTNAAGGTVLTLNPGQFQTFTGYTTTPQYVIFYSNRTTPVENTVSGTVPAGTNTTLNVPAITPTTGQSFTSAVTLGGLSGTTTATIAAQNGLFSGISAIIPNTQTVFYALDITASSPVTTTAGALCGISPCITVTLPSQTISAASSALANFYVEQCNATACPIPSTAPSELTLSGSTLNVTATQAGVVSGLGSTPVYLVFYYQ